MTKIKNYFSEDCIVLDVFIKHSIKILSVITRRINSTKNGDNKEFITRLNFCCKEYKQ